MTTTGNRESGIDLVWSRCYDFSVSPELPFNQHLRKVLRQPLRWALLSLFLSLPLHAETQKADLPDPIKFINKFDTVANAAYEVLEDMEFDIELDGRKVGKIVTRPLEFISGSLTSGEIDKFAVKRDIRNGSWLKARYSAEVLMEIVSPTETLVTIRTKVEALNRNIDGTERWGTRFP